MENSSSILEQNYEEKLLKKSTNSDLYTKLLDSNASSATIVKESFETEKIIGEQVQEPKYQKMNDIYSNKVMFDYNMS